MRSTEHQDIRRVRVLALGTGLVAAVLGALVLAFLPGLAERGATVAPTNTGEPRVYRHPARRADPADDARNVDRDAADRLRVPLVPLRGPRSAGRIRLPPDRERIGHDLRRAGRRRRIPDPRRR